MADASAQAHPNPFHVELYQELKQLYEKVHPSYRIPLVVVCVLIIFTAFFRLLVGSPRMYLFGEEDNYDAKHFKRGPRQVDSGFSFFVFSPFFTFVVFSMIINWILRFTVGDNTHQHAQ